MLLKKTNIHGQLLKTKAKYGPTEKSLFEQVQHILEDTSQRHAGIKINLMNGQNGRHNKFDFDLLEADRIFHIESIRQTCIDYRLRFLDSKYFKGEIPVEAISEINALQKKHATEIEGFKVMAPSKMFKLKDKDDPLLFAPIGNDYFYLIHKWGNDLHPLRKLLMWPFKSIINLTLVVILVSYLATLLIPEGLFSKHGTNAQFWIVFFFMFKCLASIVIFYGFALGKNFNPQIWRSKYFNA